MVEKHGLERVDLTTPWRWGSPRIWSHTTLTRPIGPISAKDGSPHGRNKYIN